MCIQLSLLKVQHHVQSIMTTIVNIWVWVRDQGLADATRSSPWQHPHHSSQRFCDCKNCHVGASSLSCNKTDTPMQLRTVLSACDSMSCDYHNTIKWQQVFQCHFLSNPSCGTYHTHPQFATDRRWSQPLQSGHSCREKALPDTG